MRLSLRKQMRIFARDLDRQAEIKMSRICQNSDFIAAISKLRALLIAVALIFPSSPAFSADSHESAKYMIKYCRLWVSPGYVDPNDNLKKGMCYGIVVALVDAYLNKDFCIYGKETDPTNVQFVSVVVRYIDHVPQRQNENFFNLAREGLRNAWPCKAS